MLEIYFTGVLSVLFIMLLIGGMLLSNNDEITLTTVIFATCLLSFLSWGGIVLMLGFVLHEWMQDET